MISNLMNRVLVCLLLVVATDLMAANPVKYVKPGQTYTIGQYAQGGVIFWLTPDLQHGLVASIVDMAGGATFRWSPNADTHTIGATSNDLSFRANYITTGKINSNLIVSYYTAHPIPGHPNYAAGACAAYTVTVDRVTYADWYLPSIGQLGLMQSMQSTINSVSVAQGGTPLQAQEYWSSSEFDSVNGWSQNFMFASQNNTGKDSSLLMRAIRSF